MFDSGYSAPNGSSSHVYHPPSNPSGLSGQESFYQQSSVVNDMPSSPVSTTSAFLLGIHNYKALDDVNLPEFVKEHQATLTFPEKLMLMLTYVDKEYKTTGSDSENLCVSWILDGRAFIIRSKEDIVKEFLPMFFRQGKFASFTRKLYRWGFRQVSVAQEHSSSNRREMIFGHEFFQRDNKSLMARMRSVTAAGTRRAVATMSIKQHQVVAQGSEKLVIEPKKVPPGGNSLLPMSLLPAPASAPSFPHIVGKEQGVPSATYKDAGGAHTSLLPLGASTLQDALAFSHQQRALLVLQPATPNDPGANDGKTNGGDAASAGAPSAAKTAAAVAYPFTQISTLALAQSATIAAAQERIRNHQEGNSDPGDPNAYMRAAVDLLLRYAS